MQVSSGNLIKGSNKACQVLDPFRSKIVPEGAGDRSNRVLDRWTTLYALQTSAACCLYAETTQHVDRDV